MSTVAIIDYGMGNLHSIAKALEYVGSGHAIRITADSETILNADRVVFPGVGAIRDCMRALTDTGLAGSIRAAAETRPLLGICLGMQALLTDSDENGHTPGLDIIAGHVRHFGDLSDSSGLRLKIPHMGWNQVHQIEHPLWAGIGKDSRFYFVHGFYAVPDDAAATAATTDYGGAFASALSRGNLFAVQFHPEKSQGAGLQLLKNFLRWNGKL